MHKTVFVLACLARASHGRRLRTSMEQQGELEMIDLRWISGAFTSHAALLQEPLSAAFSPSSSGLRFHTSNPALADLHPVVLDVWTPFHQRLNSNRYSPRVTSMSTMSEGDELESDGAPMASPAAALQRWREERINLFGSVLDCSRYHVQILIVDDDALRGRTCEAMLEKVAEWADAGWWIYPHSTSLGSVVFDLDDRKRLNAICAPFELSKLSLKRPVSEFDVNDVLEGTYDLIVCVDLEVQERVRSLVRHAVADNDTQPDATVLSLCDFLAIGGDRLDALDEPLCDLVSRQYFKGLPGIMELPRANTGQLDEWNMILAACALSCAGMTVWLKDEFDNYFVDTFNDLLNAHYKRPEHLNVSWEECEDAMRRHIVTGGLTIQERRRLFEEHQAKLRIQFSDQAEN